MAVIQSSTVERTSYLSKLDVPVTGILFSEVVCRYRKEGGILVTKTLDSSSWTEVGDGFYYVTFSPAEMNTLGYFFYTLTSTKFDNFVYDEFSIEPSPGSIAPLVPPGICVISGTLKDIGGNIPRNCRVSARAVDYPVRAGEALINSDAVYTYPDSLGNFQLSLLQGATVIFEIERTAIRNQVTVPATPTANLADLIPPINQIQ
jgi:hypothetical protein